MRNHLIELRVGEALQVGQYTVRLLEVDGAELHLEIEGDGQDGGDGFASDLLLEELCCAGAC